MGASRTPGSGSEATELPERSAFSETPGVQPGQRVGRYVVERPIGAGGMGFVVAARDPELGRTVAIKVLFRDDDKGEVWLRREAQALARLNHPGIVAVHDVGTLEGRPFIAMELVDGETLRAWLDRTKRTRDEILTVFVAAARALAGAHHCGLLHCDFKPSNVMIRTGAGTTMSLEDAVCIMDFGLARLTDEASSEAPMSPPSVADVADSILSQDFTALDKLQGTPKYMAPEQFALLGLTEATDQYAFCIALYEALWRRSPFQGETPAARMREQMCGACPTPPPHGRPRALVHAVLRGLEPLPENRWPNMTALADALQPPPKRWWWLAGGSAVAVAGAVGALGFAGEEPCSHVEAQLDAVWNERTRTQIADAFSRTDRGYATEAWARGRGDIDAWATQWTDAATENCDATFERGERSDREYDEGVHCLSRQLARLQAVTEALRTVEGGEIIEVVDSIGALPEPDGCLALEGLDRPSDPMRAALVDAVYEDLDRCEVTGTLGRARAFERCAGQVLEAARELGDENLLLDARRVEASAVLDAGERDRGAALFEGLYFDALAADRTRLAANAALSVAVLEARRGGDPEAAEAWLRHAGPLRATPAGEARLARVEALAAHFAGNSEQAVARGRRAVELAELSGDRRLQAAALNTLGKVLNENGIGTEARVVYERAVAMETEHRGEMHPRVATALNNLATVLGDAGELEGALSMLERSLAIRRAMLPHAHRHIATGTANVAETLVRLGRYDEALPLYVESAEVFAEVEGEDSWYHAVVRTQVGSLFRQLGRHDEARASLDIALEHLRDDPLHEAQRFAAESELALVDAATGEREAAIAFFESALELPLRQEDRKQAQAHLRALR